MPPNSDSPAGASSDTPPELITPLLRLRPNHRAHDRALRAGAAEFEQQYGLPVAEGLAAFVQPEERDSVAEAWNGFLVIHDTDHRLIGLCAFALAPDAQGAVEIAYAIAPSYQGQGYATEAAQALTARAFCVPGARVACAHTAPETNASTRVLVKCGFQKIGEIMHPEDGRIWRWEKRP